MDKELLDDTLLDDELLPDSGLFTSAVAQIRAKENTLLSEQALDNLMKCESVDDCIQLLQEKGWEMPESGSTESMLESEREKCWQFVRSICSETEMKYFDILRLEDDFHNLKAAIKESYIQKTVPNVYKENGTIPVETIRKCAVDNDFAPLSFTMMRAAQDAREVLFHTGDSQLCDCIIDKAALLEISKAGTDSKIPLLEQYAELKCASADISIALRACRAKKDTDFLQRSFAECRGISVPSLIAATRNGIDSIYEYLESTSYADAVPEIKAGAARFDKWCDDRMIKLIKPQKYNAFTISPIAAYVLAKEYELKSVRMILSAKLNGLDENKVRERIRESYV